MRFKITLSILDEMGSALLPASYQYELSSFIYSTLSRGDRQFATWLHSNGFELGNKQFKLFVFSHLQIPKFSMEGDRLRLLCNEMSLLISFLPERSTEEFVKGVFSEQRFELGDRQSKAALAIKSVEVVAPPRFVPEMRFRTLSPVCLSSGNESGVPQYFSIDDGRAPQAILTNLLAKYEAFYGEAYPEEVEMGFHSVSKVRSKLITMKAFTPQQTKVRGFTGEFTMRLPVELVRLAYECGVGSMNSGGFGMVQGIE